MTLKSLAVLLFAATTLAACDENPADEGTGLVGRIELTGAPENGRLFINQQFFLTAFTYAPDNSLVTNVPIKWTTSDSTILRVQRVSDTEVIVRAVGEGTGTLTVSSDGKKASLTLEVTPVPIATVRIEPGIIGLYPGGAAQLRVVATDSFGNDASSRPVTWTTSSVQRVQVDSSGRVNAEGLGEATITATIEGKSDTATVHVLPRPVSDWAQVTQDWVTYQGNALHTGYVPAIVDPLLFELKWDAELFIGPVNPVVAAEGMVFASGAIPSMHVVRALDAETGTPRWEQHVGNNSSVDPPGYGNGNVYVQTGGHEDSFLHGFRAANGTRLFQSAYGNQWSRYFAPVVVDGRVFIAGGYYGGMYAYDGEQGTQLWFRDLNQYDLFTPLVHNEIVYAYTGAYSPKLTAASASTGAVLFEIPDPEFNWTGWSMGSALTMTSPSTLLASQSNRLLSFDLPARRIRWVVNDTGNFGQPAFADGVVYVSRPTEVEARSESDGSLLWSWQVPGDAQVIAPVVVTRNLLFVSTAGPTSWATYAIDLTAGAHTWSYPVGGQLTISKDGTLYIARADGTLTAITMR